jgi:hypothetical protein
LNNSYQISASFLMGNPAYPVLDYIRVSRPVGATLARFNPARAEQE